MTATPHANGKSVSLTAQEIDIISNILNFTSRVDAQGRPQTRTFSIQELSAKKWWHKHTEEIINEHTKLYTELETKLKEEVKEETEKLQKKVKEFKTPLQGFHAKKEKGELTEEEEKTTEELTVKFQVAQAELKAHMTGIQEKLSKDEELIKSHHGTEHPLELGPETVTLIIQCFEDFEFQPNQIIAIDIFEKFKAIA